MKKKNVKVIDEQAVTDFGSIGTTIQWLWGPNDNVPHFFMRKFVIEPKGKVGLHDHPQEHELYFLSGICRVYNDKGDELEVMAGDSLFIPPDEPHGYENNGEDKVEGLCIIPRLKRPD